MIYLLHSIADEKHNSNYNTPEEVAALPADALLTFDGVYQNVWLHRDLLKGRRVILFVVGAYIGMDNRWDRGQPRENFCSHAELVDLMAMGCELGWHTWTHKDLTKLSSIEVEDEVRPPTWFPRVHFAYPYGKFDDRVERVVSHHFHKAYTVGRGDDSQYQIRRRHI